MAVGRALAVLLALAATGCASARGDDDNPDRKKPSWEERDRLHTTLVPYAWRAAAKGDGRVDGVPFEFDEGRDAGETLGGRVEVYSDRVAIFLAGFHASISDEVNGVEADARYGVYDLGVALRVAGEDPWIPPGDRKPLDLEVDGVVLLRGHFLSSEVDTPASFQPSTDEGAWGEVVVGLRAGVTILGRATVFGRIDGGGMSTGSYRSFSRNGEVGVRLRLTRNLGAEGAWRWFRSHVEGRSAATAGAELDVRLDGPWVGIVLDF